MSDTGESVVLELPQFLLAGANAGARYHIGATSNHIWRGVVKHLGERQKPL